MAVNDLVQWCINDMIKKGVVPTKPHEIKGTTGDFEVFQIGNKKNNKGRIKIFDDGYTATDWSANITVGGNINASNRNNPEYIPPVIDYEAKAALAAQKSRDERTQKVEAARLAHEIIKTSVIPDPKTHPYLKLKKLPCNGFYESTTQYKGWLIVPIYYRCKLVNLEFISPNGDKRPIKGGLRTGAYGIFGKYIEGSKQAVIIAEGAATAASIHLITRKPVFYSLGSGNMAMALRSIVGDYRVPEDVIKKVATDNDDAGRKAAEEAIKPFRAGEMSGIFVDTDRINSEYFNDWDYSDVLINCGSAGTAIINKEFNIGS